MSYEEIEESIEAKKMLEENIKSIKKKHAVPKNESIKEDESELSN